MVSSSREGRAPTADHRGADGRFRNPWPGGEAKGLGAVLRWMIWERLVHGRPRDPAPSVFARAEPAFATPRAAADALTVTWVGHSTVLLQLAGLNILTDPVWGERASPLRFAGPKRWVAPGVAFEALPPIDVVILSHNHYDHLDDATVRRIVARWPSARWMVPIGLAGFVEARGAREVHELDWWEEARVGEVTFACTPAQHFSARGLGDRGRTLWASWCALGPRHRVFFGGDTAYHPEFGAIGERYGPFDVVLMPIGAYEPRWFMRSVHMNAEEAVQAFVDLESESRTASGAVMVPIHWGTFKLTDEPMDEPPKRVEAAWAAAGLPRERLWLLRHGETREGGALSAER